MASKCSFSGYADCSVRVKPSEPNNSIESKIILVHIVQKQSEIENAEKTLQNIINTHSEHSIEYLVKILIISSSASLI